MSINSAWLDIGEEHSIMDVLVVAEECVHVQYTSTQDSSGAGVPARKPLAMHQTSNEQTPESYVQLENLRRLAGQWQLGTFTKDPRRAIR